MNWNGLPDFVSMGGYGLYVWGSYAVCAALMLIEPALAAHRHRQARRAAIEATEAAHQDN